MVWMMGLLTFFGGVLNVVQSGCNAELNKVLAQPLAIGFIMAGLYCLAYLAFTPFFGLHFPDAKSFGQVPWWAWCGGLCGAASIMCTLLFAARLGSGVYTGLIVTAGVITSVLLDHYGIIGFAQRSATVWRIVGCLVMLGGLSLVAMF